jgi:hypothetical protein
MNHLAFSWHGTSLLSAELTAGAVRATLRTMVDFPHLLTLWRADGSGLQVWSRMHDIAERVEIGVLEFALVKEKTEEPKPSSNGAREVSFIDIDLPTSFRSHNRVTKLVISEANTTAESGIVIRASDHKEIIILSSAMPYNLAIRGIFSMSMPRIFEPAYDFGCYERVEIA